MDLTSPSLGTGTTIENFSCPLCVKSFTSPPDLELHVNIEHKDVLSPASPVVYSCPVCGLALAGENDVGQQCMLKMLLLNGRFG